MSDVPVFACFEEWHELSQQKQWEIVKRLQMQTEACRRYFEHCQRVSLSARHARTDSAEMSVRMSLREDAINALGED